MYIIPQFRPFDPYGSVAKSLSRRGGGGGGGAGGISSCSFWRKS